MNDLVAFAARALRETHDGSSADDASTRRRILAEAQAALHRRRRRKFAIAWLSLAAVLVGSSAWAAVTGHAPGLVAWLRGTSRATMPVETGGSARASDAVATRIETPSAIAAIPADAPNVFGTPAVKTVATPSSTPVAAGANASPAARAMTAATRKSTLTRADAEEDLYDAAHRAHFVAHDSVAALRAWDAYLAAYPAGRFGLEARYNRALALVRLGRMAEARAALTPFADGRTGDYRQAEARSLLDAIDGGR